MVMWSKLDLRSLNCPNLHGIQFICVEISYKSSLDYICIVSSTPRMISLLLSWWRNCLCNAMEWAVNILVTWKLYNLVLTLLGAHFFLLDITIPAPILTTIPWIFREVSTVVIQTVCYCFPVHGFEYLTLKWWRHDNISSKHELFSYNLKKKHLHNMTFVC